MEFVLAISLCLTEWASSSISAGACFFLLSFFKTFFFLLGQVSSGRLRYKLEKGQVQKEATALLSDFCNS